LQREIARHQEADESYMDEGVQILELARNAQKLFERQEPRQKRVGAYRGHFRIQNDRRGLLSDGLFEGFRVGRMRHRIQGIEEGTRR
jgi:hypothetical protein